MRTLLVIIIALLAFMAYLWIRYLLRRSGIKGSNIGMVQHAPQWIPPPPPPSGFLPGSRVSDRAATRERDNALNAGPQIEQIRFRRVRRQGPDRKDMRRSFMMDALLDKPKWKNPDPEGW